ncbi:MAG: 5-histidylcysteine sulfoxide synthase [Propionivibrio sp.]|uniref:5-histidylcysteine sulfoxide synthase n=2 Tax=Propionivibrio sp. TaxID=2212460 RepID=UPI0025E8E2D0|nr:5-histidylcysteine sulfoxide synthase [Propionivibrio sp.]MBK8895579.1 5-histidylcysteine sulfoxide synthase [Propionivibrio sp.]MBL0206790.1 5-histidylcysteine sulfoxide synthase [Propionivibrio sp.]
MTIPVFPRTPVLSGTDAEKKRVEILDYFHATFDRYEQLFEVLSCDEAYYEKPIALRHPLIFYLGHTATFFVNKLLLAGLVDQRINPRFESMFAVGVDEMSWDDLNEARYDWPSVGEVKAYRVAVRETVGQLIRTQPLSLPIAWEHPWWIILMGIEHERIHLETSAVLIRQHRLKYVTAHPAWPPCRITATAPKNDLVAIPAAQFRVGRNANDIDGPLACTYYGWDNEFGRHEAATAEFQASRYLVSNREFLEFVEAGAYADESLWPDEGAGWLRFTKAEHPAFWIREGGPWRLRLMLEEVPMPWDWPVEVNYHEAKAFCNWKARVSDAPVRLPTEDEWQALRAFAGIDALACGAEERSSRNTIPANLQLDHYASSCPVTEFAHGPLFDVIGNVWQWTETPIYPFDGFEVHAVYDDFTTPTYDGRHNIIKGGSWISCGNEALPASRYAFRRHFFQHAGFRYVVSSVPATAQASQYETDRLVSEYAEFHYGDEYFDVPNFPRALAQLAIAAMGDKPAVKALDLGCATGRTSFELARHFAQVTGIDFSARFIGLGTRLAEQGRLRYTLVEEGELVVFKERSLAELGLDQVARKVEFFQGDACNLKPVFAGYDLIVAANLIDRLYNPKQFLETVHQRLNSGGLLLIASPYTWLPEHTKREAWIGGFKKDGETLNTFDGLTTILGEHFRLLRGPVSVPFVIRETKRKFQHTLSEVSIWERN